MLKKSVAKYLKFKLSARLLWSCLHTWHHDIYGIIKFPPLDGGFIDFLRLICYSQQNDVSREKPLKRTSLRGDLRKKCKKTSQDDVLKRSGMKFHVKKFKEKFVIKDSKFHYLTRNLHKFIPHLKCWNFYFEFE